MNQQTRTLVILPDGRTFAIFIEQFTDLRDMETKYRCDLVEYKGTGAGVVTGRDRYDTMQEALLAGFAAIADRTES